MRLMISVAALVLLWTTSAFATQTWYGPWSDRASTNDAVKWTTFDIADIGPDSGDMDSWSYVEHSHAPWSGQPSTLSVYVGVVVDSGVYYVEFYDWQNLAWVNLGSQSGSTYSTSLDPAFFAQNGNPLNIRVRTNGTDHVRFANLAYTW